MANHMIHVHDQWLLRGKTNDIEKLGTLRRSVPTRNVWRTK